MAVVNRFPTWGKAGEIPQAGFQYDGGDQVNEKHLNFLWDKIKKQTDDFITDIENHKTETTGIHGVGTSQIASEDYVNTTADSKITLHSDEITGVHGTGTSGVSSKDYADTTAADQITLHSNETTNVHGTGTSGVASQDYVNTTADSKISTHSLVTDAHHTRYSDAEASAAAPVQSVNGNTGDIGISSVMVDATNTINDSGTSSGTIRCGTYNVSSGTTVSVNRVLIVKASQEIIVNGTITADGEGASGGTGATQEAEPGNKGNPGILIPAGTGTGGGDGGDGFSQDNSGGDGGNGDLRTIKLKGGAVTREAILSSLSDTSILVGAGGGGGGSASNGTSGDDLPGQDGVLGGGGGGGQQEGSDGTYNRGGDGGTGGGAVVLIAPKISGSGTVSARGTAGQDGERRANRAGAGGGGGGAGGIAVMVSQDFSDETINLTAAGGPGGTGSEKDGGFHEGGDGGTGPYGISFRTN